MNRQMMIAALLLAQATAMQAAWADARWVRARGPNGVVAAGAHDGRGYVHGRTVDRDGHGNVARASGWRATGERGTAARQRSYERDADGSVTASRSTQLHSAASGNGYSGTTTYTRGAGFTHAGSCSDAAGTAIACPAR